MKEPELLTLEEYYNKKNVKHEVKEEPKEVKKKVDLTQQKLDGLEIVKNKDQVTLDEGKQSKQVKEVSHKLASSSENSELLGFYI